MSADVPPGLSLHGRSTRLQREALEVEAAIALVAGGSHYRVMLCGLRHGGRLVVAMAAEAAAVGVQLEPLGRDRNITDIRVHRA